MTSEQLKEKLEKYSPFKFEGGNEKYDFRNNDKIYIDDELFWTYKIVDTDTGLKIQTISGLMTFHKNVIIDFGEKESCVIVNHESDKLLELPDNWRHSAAVGGFFILKSLNINK